MALVSVLPLGSTSRLHKSLVSYIHEPRPFSNLGICRGGKSVPPSLSLGLTTAASDDGVQRRICEHHPNLWDDDFIQSLSTPYGEPSYRERAERLIGEVKEIFNSMFLEDGKPVSPLNDLIQRLWMVDSVERLGIDRHFKNEIKSALDYVYRYWNDKGIGRGRDSIVTNLNSTALGFRILRLHGYTVSSEVLKVFEDQNGQFATSPSQAEGKIRSVLNLYRASLIAFPGEKVMEEAEIFSTRYLKEALQNIPVSALSQEIKFVMEYGWHTNIPRWEARNYMDVFGDSSPWLNTNTRNTEKLLELAKLEFNIFNSLQYMELQCLMRWWKDSPLSELTFARHRHVEFYTLASCIDIEPKHYAFRLGFTKMCQLLTVLDDIYDTFGTMNELELFTSSIKRWDPSEIEHLPEYMKAVYMALFEAINEMAREAQKTQGRSTLNYVRKAWEDYFDSYLEEAKWISSGYVPTFKEYYENGKVSSGYRVATLQPILTLNVRLSTYILKGLDFPSRFNDLASSFLRLRGDTRCYKANKASGEEASCISCYMKDHHGSTEEDALNHINAMVNDIIKELNWELLRSDDNIPMLAKKHAFDITRAFHHLYMYQVVFSVSNQETKDLVMKTLIEYLLL